MPARATGATAPRGQFASRLLPAAHGRPTHAGRVDDWWKLCFPNVLRTVN